MMMKRKRSSNREAMERTEFRSEATRLLREFQYLGEKIEAVKILQFETGAHGLHRILVQAEIGRAHV